MARFLLGLATSLALACGCATADVAQETAPPASGGAGGSSSAPRRTAPATVPSGAIPGAVVGTVYVARDWTTGDASGTWADHGFALPLPPRCRAKSPREPGPVDNAFARVLLPTLVTWLGPLRHASASPHTYALRATSEHAFSLFPVAARTDPSGNIVFPTDADWSAGTYVWFPLSASTKMGVFDAAGYDGALGGTADESAFLLVFEKAPLHLPVQRPYVRGTFETDDTLRVDVGGVVPISALRSPLIHALRRADLGCALPLALVDALADAADSLESGGVHPDRDCDAISVGIGGPFWRAQLGQAVEDFMDIPCPND